MPPRQYQNTATPRIVVARYFTRMHIIMYGGNTRVSNWRACCMTGVGDAHTATASASVADGRGRAETDFIMGLKKKKTAASNSG